MPLLSATVGASRLEHLVDAITAPDLPLPDEERPLFEEAAPPPHAVLGHD
jgi:hypothetical protein